MGSVLGGSKKSTTVNTTTFPDWAGDPLKDIVSQATDLMNKPYSPYSGNQLAGLTPDQLQAFDQVRANQGIGAQGISQAQDITAQVAQRGLSGFSQDQLNQWMNPYQQNVIDATNNEMFRAYDKSKNDLQQRNAATAAFGGSRAAVGDELLRDNFLRNMSLTNANLLYQGYNDAQNRAMQGTQLAGQAAMDLANQAQSKSASNYQDATYLENIGQTQQGQEQKGLDVDYQNWATQQAYPYQQIQFGNSIISPIADMAKGSTSVSKQSGGGSGLLGTALGIGSMMMGIPGVGSAMMGGLGGLASGMGSIGMGSMMSSIGAQMGAGNSFGQAWNLYKNANAFGPPAPFKEGGQVEANPAPKTLEQRMESFYTELLGGDEPSVPAFNCGGKVPAFRKGGPVQDYLAERGNAMHNLFGIQPDYTTFMPQGMQDFIWEHPIETLVGVPVLGAAALDFGAGALGSATTGLVGKAGSMIGTAGKALAKSLPTVGKALGKAGLAYAAGDTATGGGLSSWASDAASVLRDKIKELHDSTEQDDTGVDPVSKASHDAIYAKKELNSDTTDPLDAKATLEFNGPELPTDGSLPPDLPVKEETSQLGLPFVTEQPQAQTKQEKKEELNLPLIAFGAALMGSDKSFFQALGDAGLAYVSTTTAEEKAAAENALNARKFAFDQLKSNRDYEIDKLKAAAYARQVDLADSDLKKEVQRAKIEKMRADIANAGIKNRNDLQKALIGMGIPADQISQQMDILMPQNPNHAGLSIISQ